MRGTRYTEEQIVALVKEHERCVGTDELCRRHGISQQTFYRWKKQFVGMGVTEIRRLKQLEEENGKLKKIVADLTLDKTMLQDVLRRKW